jgi:c-di-GMP-related signal transduction protein
MEVYVGRQPIFDRYNNVLGYELLYRRSMNNFYEGNDADKDTAEVINNAFFVMHFDDLTEGTKAFINFTETMIVDNVPMLLPKETLVVEILEQSIISQDLIESCRKLKQAGYRIALDDFVFSTQYLPLLELVDIVKIEFSNVSLFDQRLLLSRYKNKIMFLAEKVETREEYDLALNMGYDYFQGYFFSKPVIYKGKDIAVLNTNIIRIINELYADEPEFDRISGIIQSDLGLSYKLLKVSNTVYFEAKHEIKSIKQAIIRLGISELKRWFNILLVKDIQIVENRDLIKNSIIRAKFMELIAMESATNQEYLDYFMVGMFSSIDILLNRDMKSIVEELPFTSDVKDALCGVDNPINIALKAILDHEYNRLNDLDLDYPINGITQSKFMELYIQAINWVKKND